MSAGKTGWIAVGAAAAIVAFQVLVPPAIGLADNGDFGKITGQFDLYPAGTDLHETAFRYITLQYEVRSENHIEPRFHSSEGLLIEAAFLLNRLVTAPGVFDLRAMGVVHASIFLLAFGLFVPLVRDLRPPIRIAILAGAVLLFCDVAFSAYYNSFYLDAGALVFLMLSLVMLLRALKRRRPTETYIAVAVLLLLVTAKSQHALLAVPVALLLVWQRHRLWPRRAVLASALAAAAVAGAGAYSLLEGSPRGYTAPCLFDIVFARLLPTAKNPSMELASLGLDKSYLRYTGMDAYEERSPMRDPRWVRSFLSKTSFGKLCKFYVKHPDRAWQVAKFGLEAAAQGRPAEVGNYDRSAGREPFARSNAFSLWSTARRALLRNRLWLYPLIFAVSLWIIGRRFPAYGAALFLAGLIEFGLGAMTDALEVTRHLFLFNAVWDVTLFAALCTIAAARGSRPEGLQLESAEPAVREATGVATEYAPTA